MNFPARFQGVFFSPAPVFKALAEKPKWVDAFVVVLLFIALAGYFTAPIATQETLKGMKDNPKLEEKMGKERYEGMIRNMESGGSGGALLRSVVLGPVIFTLGLFSLSGYEANLPVVAAFP